MNKPDVKKLILLNLPYVFAFYFADKIAAVFRLAPGTEFIDKLTNGFAVFGSAFANPLPSFHPVDLLIGLSAGVLLKLAVYVKGKNRKKFRQGEEYGSARWGKPEDIKPYTDPEFSNNVILTQTEFLTMNSRPKQPKYARNKNILVIGGSGSGKTRFFVKPNLMQMHSSYVVTDPKGTVLVECGKMLEKGGYVIKSLNTINFRKSMHYNPFSYIRSEKDILKLVNTIIVNTKGDGDKSGEDFWVKAEKLYYTALIGYIWYEAPDHEKNFTTLLEMINASEAREDDETFKNPVDVMFDELEARDPDHFAVKQYRKYKLAAGKTAKSILISCGARLAPFDIAELRELMSYDEMELDTIGDRKTALFVIISDTDDTFNFVVAIMYSQLFNLLCDKADDVYNGRLPVHVRCLLDEFANIGQIPKFDKLIATIRSREISASIILQSQSQLKTIYKDAADTITGNCDCTLFLGGKEKSTLKEISEVLGKETIDLYNTSETRSNNNSYGLNYQKTGKELMSQDEIAVMDGAKCILQLRGVRPFLSNKYDITKHPKYRQLSDYDKRNAFDIEKYRQHKLVVKPDDTFDLYDMGEVEADYTGTNFCRPQFTQMMEKVKRGEINLICVKDFSRFSRDYIETGNYLECTFPFMGVRFISINDGYDSDDYKGTTGGLEVVMRSIIYAAYSKDLSVKTTSAKVQMMKQGKYVGGFAPYGYVLHPTIRNKLAIDPEAADVIRRIFREALEGSNTSRIARSLNDDGIPTPGQYFKRKHPGKKKFNRMSEKVCWETSMVYNILKNLVYTGTLVSHKMKSCGVGSRRQVPNEPIIVEGTHEAIVSKEDFELAQKVIRGGERNPTRKQHDYPLKGLVRCGNCKRVMTRRKNQAGIRFYQCTHSVNNGNTDCPVGKSFPEMNIEKVVFNAITQFLALVQKEAVQNHEVGDLRKSAIKECADKIRSLQKQNEQHKASKLRLYEKYAAGNITKEAYIQQKAATDAKIAENDETIQRSHERMKELDSETSCSDEKLDAVCDQYADCKALTYELTHAFISAVYIYDLDNIEIVWKFKDFLNTSEGEAK